MKSKSILVLAIMLITAAFCQAVECEIIDLGTLGGNNSIAYAINDSNQIVGRSRNASGVYNPFFWQDLNHNGQSDPCEMQDLGNLGGSSSFAFAINSKGLVVGQSENAEGKPHAFIWENGVMTDLGTFGGLYSKAFGINDSNQVVGIFDSSPCDHIFLWEDEIMTDLYSEVGCGDWVGGINNAGQVVAYGWLWESGETTDLGILQGKAINETGEVAGYYVNHSANYRAFFWEDGNTVTLVTLGGWESKAYGINDANQVVGQSRNVINDQRAFLYTHGIMIDLNALLPQDSEWELMEALDINNKGQIVGWGYIGSEQHAFLLALPDLGPFCLQAILGDINGDCRVNLRDFQKIALNWLECNLDPPEACWE